MEALKIGLAIATLLTTLAMAAGTVWGIVNGIPIMVISCGLLTAGLGLFVYADYKKYFGKKS